MQLLVVLHKGNLQANVEQPLKRLIQAAIVSERLIILVQQYLELGGQKLDTYQDVTGKADIWQPISIQMHAVLLQRRICPHQPFFVNDIISSLDKDLGLRLEWKILGKMAFLPSDSIDPIP